MKTAIRILRLILVTLFAVTSAASADRKTYIIHMDNSKVLEQLNSFYKQPWEWYEEILQFTRTSADEDHERFAPELLYTYETTMTGFSAKLTSEQYSSLANIDGLLYVAQDEIRSPQTTYLPHFIRPSRVMEQKWLEAPGISCHNY